MTYLTMNYFILVAVVLAVYYSLPMKVRWISLLAGSVAFYMLAYRAGWWIILITAALSFGLALLLEYIYSKDKQDKQKKRFLLLQKLVLAAAIIAVCIPWFLTKNVNTILTSIFSRNAISWIVPMGISFYTLQIVAYLVDVYRGKIHAEKNPLKYALYIIYFPQILQGPIPRYDKLSGQLYEGHRFDEEKFLRGVLLIIWGFFLKFMIADKASIIVNPIFDNYRQYRGMYVLVGGLLYSAQLYADFSACMSISKGVSFLFGITLEDNFAQPYFSTSIQDFWRRWHISLSSWLRDYIYIPLGGSRKGKTRKYINLAITFLVSGIWHGAGLNFILWGLMHAVYQITGAITKPLRLKLKGRLDAKNAVPWKQLSVVWTFLCVMVAWIVFRADSWRIALSMLKSVLTVHNFWIFTDDSLLELGLSLKQWIVLALSILALWAVSRRKEQGVDVAGEIIALPLVFRWCVLLASIFAVMIFGTYGSGFDAQAFIYGGF